MGRAEDGASPCNHNKGMGWGSKNMYRMIVFSASVCRSQCSEPYHSGISVSKEQEMCIDGGKCPRGPTPFAVEVSILSDSLGPHCLDHMMQ